MALEAGRRIGPPHVLLLANLGCAEVEVVRRPRVAVLATGSEVVEDLSRAIASGPGTQLQCALSDERPGRLGL